MPIVAVTRLAAVAQPLGALAANRRPRAPCAWAGQLRQPRGARRIDGRIGQQHVVGHFGHQLGFAHFGRGQPDGAGRHLQARQLPRLVRLGMRAHVQIVVVGIGRPAARCCVDTVLASITIAGVADGSMRAAFATRQRSGEADNVPCQADCHAAATDVTRYLRSRLAAHVVVFQQLEVLDPRHVVQLIASFCRA